MMTRYLAFLQNERKKVSYTSLYTAPASDANYFQEVQKINAPDVDGLEQKSAICNLEGFLHFPSP